MNLEQLKIFISVVEHGSFTKAAQALYISHSTTSRNVAALEDELGVQLLYRNSRKVVLTPAGQLLFKDGKQFLQDAELLENAVRNAGKGMTGELSVASVNMYSQKMFIGCKEFCARYPDVVLGMFHKEMSEIVGQVLSGEADMGISFSYALPESLPGCGTMSVERSRFCLVAPVGHPLARKKAVTAEDMKDISYISVGAQRSGFAKKLEDAMLCGKSEMEILSVPTLESLFLQVRSGNGVSMVPHPMACEYGANCSILDIDETDSSFDVVLFWREDNENPSLSLFLELMKELCEEGKK